MADIEKSEKWIQAATLQPQEQRWQAHLKKGLGERIGKALSKRTVGANSKSSRNDRN